MTMLDDSSPAEQGRPMQYRMVGGDRKEYGPVSADQLRQWIAEGRANGDTLVQAEGGLWTKLSSRPEFAESLRSVPAAASAAMPPPTIGGPTYRPAAERDPKTAVQGPAIGLIVLGVICLPMAVIGLITHLLGGPMDYPQSFGTPEMDRIMEILTGGVGTAIYAFETVISALILLGGIRMLRLRNYGLCVTAAVLALVPCVSPCCCLGLPLGIWAVVVLLKPEVRSSFS